MVIVWMKKSTVMNQPLKIWVVWAAHTVVSRQEVRDYDNGPSKEEDKRLKVTITYRNLPKLTMN